MFSGYPLCKIAPKHTDEQDEGFINTLICMYVEVEHTDGKTYHRQKIFIGS